MPPPDDRTLIRKFRSGDRAAFEGLVHRYADRVAAVARRALGDREEALDVAQEVFFEAFRMLPGWKEEGQLFSWLYRTALNICSHRLRRRRRVAPLETAPPPAVEPAPDPEDDRLAAIRAALDSLPPRQRDVFVLVHELGLPLAEAGRRLGLATGTVKAHLHRALCALRDALRNRKLM